MNDTPAFFIRDVPIHGPLILAPLSGYNDQPFRRLCLEFGASLVYTGLLSASAILYGSQRSREMLRFHADEHPLACQLFGSDADMLAKAARAVEALGIDLLDFNMGCAEPKIVKGGYGSALLKDPALIERIVTRLVTTVRVPVTGKIRLGWDAGSRNHLEVARILEDSGAAMIAVHGRTADQQYTGLADWDAIAEVRDGVARPRNRQRRRAHASGYRGHQGGHRLRGSHDRARRHRQPVDLSAARCARRNARRARRGDALPPGANGCLLWRAPGGDSLPQTRRALRAGARRRHDAASAVGRSRD